MEEPQRSRHATRTHVSKRIANEKDFSGSRTVYDDVFGRPPKYSVPSFPPCIDDYKEIFRLSSTVPFLEFSSGFSEGDGNGLLLSGDSFADIFGGYGDGFLLSFEELVGRKEKKMERKDSGGEHSRRSRVNNERQSSQKVPTKLSGMSWKTSNGVLQVPSNISRISSENSDDRLFSILDNIPTLMDSAPQHLDVFEKQLNMVDLMASNELKEGPYRMEPMPDLMEDSSGYKAKRSTSLTGSFGDSEPQALRNESRDDSGVIHTKPLPVENSPSFNLNIQASCGDYDVDKSTGVFFTITDTILQTHPSQLPPSSKPPPNLALKSGPKKKLSSSVNNLEENGHSLTLQSNQGWNQIEVALETHSVEAELRPSSPPFFGIEVDANSDAAVSAAAMKEVMEEAKAKLKFLKESMARRSSLKIDRSLSGRQKVRSKEHEECEVDQEFFDCNIDIDHEVWNGPCFKTEHSGGVERAEFDSQGSLSELKHANMQVDAHKLSEQEKLAKFTNDAAVHDQEPLVVEAENTIKDPLPNEENNLKTCDTESIISVALETNDQKEGSDRLVTCEASAISHKTQETEQNTTEEHVEGEISELNKDNVAHEDGENAHAFKMSQDVSDMDASETRSECDPQISIQEIEDKQVDGYREINPSEEYRFKMDQQEDEEKKKPENGQKNPKENEEECEIPVRCGNHQQSECLTTLNVNHASTSPTIPETGHSNKGKTAHELVEQEAPSILEEDANHAPSKQGVCQNSSENSVHDLVEQKENAMQEQDTNNFITKQDVPCSNIAYEHVVQEEITMSKAVLEDLEHDQEAKIFIMDRDEGDANVENSAKRSNIVRLVQESNRKSEASSQITQPEKEHVLQAANQINEEKRFRKFSETTTHEITQKEDAELHKERLKRAREQEMERLMKLEEEKEREREREKDGIAVERATHEACNKALADAWDKAERAAVERATAEARERVSMDHQEKAEKVPPEFKEKISAEKSSTESRVRTDRYAIDRASAEARERAVERAIVEKVAAEARERMERAVAERFAASLREKRKKDSERDNGASTRVSITKHTSTSEVQSITRDASHVATHKQVGVETEKRRQARLERYQRTTERATKALAEKKARDILAQREQAERHRLAETLDAEIRRWSNGKEGNLRALISTLQYILGSESGWQPVPLTEVVTSAAVKKAYRKATLCVHPDKVQQRGASLQQKYISEKVFDLLKEAWNKFNSEER